MSNPTLAYTAPFAGFVLLMAVGDWLDLSPRSAYPLRTAAAFLLWLIFSRRLISLRPGRPLAGALLGAAVFLIWIAPDRLWPCYRGHWLFQNPLTGSPARSLEVDWGRDLWFLIVRTVGVAVVVPLAEELFWRGWLMRWLVDRRFVQVPLGHYSAQAFWLTAVLFALEHGAHWDVGLAAGAAYNWWLVRRKNLADCVWAHGVTNLCLAVYVLKAGAWEYWP